MRNVRRTRKNLFSTQFHYLQMTLAEQIDSRDSCARGRSEPSTVVNNRSNEVKLDPFAKFRTISRTKSETRLGVLTLPSLEVILGRRK